MNNNEIYARVIKDSINPYGNRLTTIHVRYPRLGHSELMTHRVFSRNGRSSRAVPVKRLLKESIFTPVFLKNKPGMQGGEELTGIRSWLAEFIWNTMARVCKLGVWALSKLDVHKQHANRPLEWFGWIDVLITSTEWNNFLFLRDHPDAQPELRELAQAIKHALDESTPVKRYSLRHLSYIDWHCPYVNDDNDEDDIVRFLFGDFLGGAGPMEVELILDHMKMLSVARCARISYAPFDGDGSIKKEIDRYKKLVGSTPLHASPAEHQAVPDTQDENGNWDHPEEHGNLTGWRQLRKMLPNENMERS